MLYPDESGYPDLDALKAALSDRTAGIMITNPEDTGLYNPRISEYTDAVHAVGALCSYDQANLNGIMGIARAREAGFDLCHFNLHKTFSSPHGSMGPAAGAVMVRDFSAPLPAPAPGRVRRQPVLPRLRPASTASARCGAFMGNLQVVLRSYSWVMALGAEGLRGLGRDRGAEQQLSDRTVRGGARSRAAVRAGCAAARRGALHAGGRSRPTPASAPRTSRRRIVDYGVNNYFSSHEPWVVPEPFTPEPAESYSQADIDEYAEIIERVAEEAYTNPEVFTECPHKSSAPALREDPMFHIDQVITTWRVWLKQQGA